MPYRSPFSTLPDSLLRSSPQAILPPNGKAEPAISSPPPSEFGMTRPVVRLVLLLPALILMLGCVHYQTYDFDWFSKEYPRGLSISVTTLGTSEIQDWAGYAIERRANPYWVGVYVERWSAVPVEVLGVTLVGERSGVVISPRMGSPERLGHGSLTVVSAAPKVQLPFENYRVEVRLRIGKGAEARDARATGTLHARLEQSMALRFWEEWMSV